MGSSRQGDSRGLGFGPRIAPSLAFLFAAATPLGADPLIVPRYGSAASPPFVIGLIALGVLLGLLAYTLFLSFSTREPMFLYFSVIMALLTVLQTFSTYDRFLFRLTYNRVTLVTHLLFATFLLFFEDFFSLATRRPRLSSFNRASIAIIAGYTAFFFLAKTLFPSAAALHLIVDFVRELFVFYTNALFIYTIVAAIAWMRTEALLILIAFIPPAILTSINAMNIFPFMRRYGRIVEFLMQYNQPIGLSLQAVLFSLAMGNRYNRIKLERQESLRESERLRRLDAEKTDFFLNLSHETRTPLTIILGMTRQLRQGRYGDSIRANDRILGAIERNSQRLLRQVSHMLRLGRPRQTLELVDLPVDPALRAIVEDFAAIAEQRNLAMDYSPGRGTEALALRVSIDDFETLVMNLLSNAVKYCYSGGSIRLSTRLGNDGSFAVEVSDTGPGIAAEQAERVFERYRSVPGPSYRQQTGLGLYLVKSVMESYGGEVRLESESGSGSRFTLVFPALALASRREREAYSAERRPGLGPLYAAEFELPAGIEASEPAADRPGDGAPRLLVVEDDPDMRSYVASVLGANYQVETAGSAQEGLARLEGRRFDLIVSDVMMPEMDGHAFLKALRERTRENPVPLVFLTARDSMEERIDSLREGALRYITKPFSPEMLTAAIASLLKHDRELVGTRVERLRRGIDALLGEMERPRSAGLRAAAGLDGEDLERFTAHFGLSARERDVVGLMIEGKTDKEIAVALNLSPRTIANHNRRIYRKTGTSGRLELVSKVFVDHRA